MKVLKVDSNFKLIKFLAEKNNLTIKERTFLNSFLNYCNLKNQNDFVIYNNAMIKKSLYDFIEYNSIDIDIKELIENDILFYEKE